MKSAAPFTAGLVGLLLVPSGASAAVASSNALVQEITSQFAGMPGYSGLQTWAVYVQYENPTDRMLNHGLAAIQATSGTFFNGNPGPLPGPGPAGGDDPLSLITQALTPVSLPPDILALPTYALWQWDTNLSMDNNPLSIAEAGSMETSTLITGGAFIAPPPLGVFAGPDLLIQIAQITVTAGGTAFGETIVLTINPAGGNPIATAITIDIPGKPEPCPADLSGDGEINSVDLGVLLASWSIPHLSPGCGGAIPCPADLSGDGAVNSFDLGILLSQWGGC